MTTQPNEDTCGLTIYSGGQTGADRAALDWAISENIPHGGWCPRGRKAENGRIPARYQLQETVSTGYAERTERNVMEADATVVFTLQQRLVCCESRSTRCLSQSVPVSRYQRRKWAYAGRASRRRMNRVASNWSGSFCCGTTFKTKRRPNSRVGQRLAQVAVQRARVGSVGFVHQHENFHRVVEQRKLLEVDVLRERDLLLDDQLMPARLLFLADNGHRHLLARLTARLRTRG